MNTEEIQALEAKLAEAKEHSRRELLSLVNVCATEMRNVEHFDDARMLIATADLKRHFDYIDASAELLEQAWNELNAAREEQIEALTTFFTEATQ